MIDFEGLDFGITIGLRVDGLGNGIDLDGFGIELDLNNDDVDVLEYDGKDFPCGCLCILRCLLENQPYLRQNLSCWKNH